MAKKQKVWLNNKLNKHLRCTVVIKFYHIFITELVLTFFVFKVIPWFCIAHLLLRITRWPP